MAGNPLEKYFPFIKRNAIVLFIGFGGVAYLARLRRNQKTYKWIYSKNDFERRYHLEKLEEFIENNTVHK